MRKFAKDEAKMRQFADGSRGYLSKKGTHKGRKVKTGHIARAGKKVAVKKRKNWKHTGAKSKLA